MPITIFENQLELMRPAASLFYAHAGRALGRGIVLIGHIKGLLKIRQIKFRYLAHNLLGFLRELKILLRA